jgi:hypothetical protein
VTPSSPTYPRSIASFAIAGAISRPRRARCAPRIGLELERRVIDDVRIRLVNEQAAFLAADPRREQERPVPGDVEPQTGQEARPTRVQTVAGRGAGPHLPVAIRDDERVAGREHERPIVADRRRRRGDLEFRTGFGVYAMHCAPGSPLRVPAPDSAFA